MNEKPAKKGKWFKWFIWLRITGIIIFIIVLMQVDLSQTWKQIRTVNLWFLLLAIISQFILLIAKGIRWNMLLKRKMTRRDVFQSMGEFMESYAIGVITPGRVGELMKAGYQKTREGVMASGLKIVAERGIDVGFFILVAGFAVAGMTLQKIPPGPGYLLIAAGLALIILSVVIINEKISLAFVHRLFPKYSQIFDRHGIRTTVNIILLSAISNAFAFISCWFLGLGIDLPLSFLAISGGVAFAGLLNMLPVTVMGLGTRELTFLFVFSQIPETQVLALSGLVLLVAQIGGGVMALVMGHIFLFLKKRV